MAKWSGSGNTLTATVVKGDTLWDIAATASSKLGKKITYQNLASWNKISNPNKISIGQVIKCYNPGSSSGSSSSSNPGNVVTITAFGQDANDNNKLFARWTWGKESETESYEVSWDYANGSGVWWYNTSTNTLSEHTNWTARHSDFSIPADATRIRFRVKPISKKKKDSKGKETSYWTGKWTEWKYWDKGAAPAPPPVPEVKIDKNRITSTIRYDAVDLDGITHVQFQIMKNDSTKGLTKSDKIALSGGTASYTYLGADGSEYKVSARVYIKSRDVYSEWSNWSDNVATKPVSPKEITIIRAESSTSVYLAWTKVDLATEYDIEYIEDKRYFDNSDMVQQQPVGKTDNTTESLPTSYLITGLESGKEYFFRVRAWRSEDGSNKIASAWSGIKSVVVGTKPAAPTTWSSSSTVTDGKDVNLYWVHNSKDGSRQKTAKLRLTGVADAPVTILLGITDVDNEYVSYKYKEVKEEDPEPTYVCALKTSAFSEGAKIEWQVCTQGILPDYGEWSTSRTIEVYSTPVVSLSMEPTITSFPIYISAVATPNNDIQKPTGYYVSIAATEPYETTDNLGNVKMVNTGDLIYSEYFNPDVTNQLHLELLPSSISLENGMSYRITCLASMSSGLTAEFTSPFDVSWDVAVCEPNAEIGVNKELLTASIRPYCETADIKYYRVNCDDFKKGSEITNTTTTDLLAMEGSVITGVYTTDDLPVYLYGQLSDNGDIVSTYYTMDGGKYYNVQIGSTYVATPTEIDYLYGEPVTKRSGKVTTAMTTDTYVKSNDLMEAVECDLLSNALTTGGEKVYSYDDRGITRYCLFYYIRREKEIEALEGVELPGAFTTDNSQVFYVELDDTRQYYTIVNGKYYSVGTVYHPIKHAKANVYAGMQDEGNHILFCTVESREKFEDVWLSVYRREFDGSFTEIASNIDGNNRTTVTDPHPALDYARYRIVAADKATGHIEYYDCPAYPVGGIAAVLQWDEEVRDFDALGDIAPAESELTGSMLKLPYNIDVSDSTKPDAKLVEYIGRSHPVSYYGTHLGSSSSWNMVIDKQDSETIYALRRLQSWLGDVYVREPSGTGYWAQVTVSFSQKHCEVTIPVSLSITRVEGGA